MESNTAIVTQQIKLIIERANYHVNVSAGEFETPLQSIVCPTN